MEETPPPSTAANKREGKAPFRYIKRGCLLMAASFEEGFGYVKAAVVGLTKKLTAKTEKEAADADLQEAKMQVAATDHAEDIKKRLD